MVNNFDNVSLKNTLKAGSPATVVGQPSQVPSPQVPSPQVPSPQVPSQVFQ
jgi:hypothetical protein